MLVGQFPGAFTWVMPLATHSISLTRSGRVLPRAAILAIAALLVPHLAYGANFTVTGNDTAAKTLNTGETGTVTAPSGDLNVSGSTATVTVSGGTVSINNAGKIRQTGTARTIDANVAGTSLTIVNSGTISSVGGNETIRMNQNATLTLTNQLGAFITSLAADAIRPGNNSTITNFGTISATPPNVASPAGSDGIDLRTERTGITINNSGTISGRHGIATDGANVGPSSVTVNNNAGGVIFALNGSGLNIDGVSTTATANVTNAFGATIKGGVYSAATDGDGDGIDVDGVLTLNNSGDVLGLGAKGGSNNAEGIAAGGGSITNTATGRIIGSTLLADAPNGDSSHGGNGILIDDSNGGNAVAATTVINSGLIQGKSGFGIKMIGTFGDTVTNNAGGTIRGTGTAAVVDTGDGNDTVTNAGSIIHDGGSSQTAIDLGGGNDTLNHNGGTITGAIKGGAGTNTLNLGAGASHGSATQNFQNVNVASGTGTLAGVVSGTTLSKGGTGTLVLSGANDYTGTTTVSAGKLLVNNVAGSGTGSGSVLVNTGGTLGGIGFISGPITVDGIIAPGNSIGTLSVGNSVTWNGSTGNKWNFELGAANTSDRLNITGDFLKGSGGNFYFDFLDSAATGIYVLVDWSNGSNFVASDFSYVNLGAGLTGAFAFNGSQLEFTTTAIPEPATTGLITGAGVLGFALYLRRRRVVAA